jgi:hypothetical protein
VKFENTEVFNFEGALRGMRNPKDSWDKSDGYYTCQSPNRNARYIVGNNDMQLAKALIKAGKEHRKFLRQIMVCVDITAPRYWWSEFDTYKIGTTANSCSTMHKLDAYPITRDMFEVDEYFPHNDSMYNAIEMLEWLRNEYNKTKDIKYFRAMKQRLPESFLQKRTVTMNYENLYEFIRQRSTHRLKEWSKDMMMWIKTLPYADEFLFGGING